MVAKSTVILMRTKVKIILFVATTFFILFYLWLYFSNAGGRSFFDALGLILDLFYGPDFPI